MQDQNLVNTKIRELNGGQETGDWTEIPGTHAFLAVSGNFRANTNVVFRGDSGIAVKIFIHSTTGEMKIYPAIMFEQNG